eukprot:5589895-Prymnesium_polylepis.1
MRANALRRGLPSVPAVATKLTTPQTKSRGMRALGAGGGHSSTSSHGTARRPQPPTACAHYSVAGAG